MELEKMDEALEKIFSSEKKVVISEDANRQMNIRMTLPEPFVLPMVCDAVLSMMAGCVRQGILSREVCRAVLESMPEALDERIEKMDGTRAVLMRRKEKAE